MKKVFVTLCLAVTVLCVAKGASAYFAPAGYVRHVGLYSSGKSSGAVGVILEDAYGRPLTVCNAPGAKANSNPWMSSQNLVFVPSHSLTERFLATLLTAKAQRLKVSLVVKDNLSTSIGWLAEGHCTIDSFTVE